MVVKEDCSISARVDFEYVFTAIWPMYSVGTWRVRRRTVLRDFQMNALRALSMDGVSAKDFKMSSLDDLMRKW